MGLAIFPQIDWNAQQQVFEVAWSDFRNSPNGVCMAGCQMSIFQRRVASDGTILGNCTGGCEDELWSGYTLVPGRFSTGRSADSTGHLFTVLAGSGSQPRFGCGPTLTKSFG